MYELRVTLLSSILFFLIGSLEVRAEDLKNWPPQNPKVVADVYKQGAFMEERVCHPNDTQSFACDIVLMPDGTGRVILYTNDTIPIKMIAIHPNGQSRVVWEAIQI